VIIIKEIAKNENKGIEEDKTNGKGTAVPGTTGRILNITPKIPLTQNSKREILNKAFDFMLPVLPEFIGNKLQNISKNAWWQKYVLNRLKYNEARGLPKNGTYNEYIGNLDILLCLKIIINNWNKIFKHISKTIQHSWVYELKEIRNEVSHWSMEISTKYTFDIISHSLDVMKLFMHLIDTNVEEQISEIMREFRSKYENGS
jgi:uncharacterized protein with HEPN domain